MIATSKRLILTARNLCIEARFYECLYADNSSGKTVVELKQSIFNLLKQNGFSFDSSTFDENGKFRGDNYGNYELEKITMADFQKIEADVFVKELKYYLENLFLQYQDLPDNEKRDFIKTVVASCDLFIDFTAKNIEVFEFAIDNPEMGLKRHKHYSLWEHFKSYIIFFSKGSNNSFTYLQIGFD
jgi:hypothetical protein